MPWILIIGGVAALLAWKGLTRESPFIQMENQKAAEELARLNSLALWNRYQPTGYSDKEKFFLTALQSFLDAWYGVDVTTENLADFLAASEDVWRRSGSGLRPMILGLPLNYQPRIVGITNQSLMTAYAQGKLRVIVKSWQAEKVRVISPLELPRFEMAIAQKKHALGVAKTGKIGLAWGCYLMTDQANEPSWTNAKNGRSELTQNQLVAMIPQIVASAWSGGA